MGKKDKMNNILIILKARELKKTISVIYYEG